MELWNYTRVFFCCLEPIPNFSNRLPSIFAGNLVMAPLLSGRTGCAPMHLRSGTHQSPSDAVQQGRPFLSKQRSMNALPLICYLTVIFSPSLLNASECVDSSRVSISEKTNQARAESSDSWISSHESFRLRSMMYKSSCGELRKPRHEPKNAKVLALRGGSQSTVKSEASKASATSTSATAAISTDVSGKTAEAPSPTGIWQSFKRLRRGIISTSVEKASLDAFGQPGIFRVSQPSVRFSVICPGTSFGTSLPRCTILASQSSPPQYPPKETTRPG
jgi:hypothetical protein